MDYWLYREWGPPQSGGWLDWDAAEFARARTARNVYIAMTGYVQATNLVNWCNDNPAAWELVTSIFEMRGGVTNG